MVNILNNKRLKIRLLNLILFGMTLCICVCLLEFILSRMDTYIVQKKKEQRFYKPDIKLHHRYVPGAEGFFYGPCKYFVEINSDGYRDHGFSQNKKKGIYRIIALGDSTTFGAGLEVEKTYAKQLESMLNKRILNREFEVYNAGVGGYSSAQGFYIFAHELLQFQPDLVVVSFDSNDVVHRYGEPSDNSMLYRLDDGHNFYKNLKIKISSKSFLLSYYNLFKKRMWAVKKNFRKNSNVSNPANMKKENIVFPARVSIENYKKNLSGIANVAKRNNINMIFLNYPIASIFKDSPYNYRYTPDLLVDIIKYEKAMKEVAAAYDVRFIDMTNVFLDNADKKLFFNDDFHPTAEGHRIIAEDLFETIILLLNKLEVSDCTNES